MNERIRKLRKLLGLTLKKFAAPLGVGKTAISKIENGERGVTDQMIKSCIMFSPFILSLTLHVFLSV